MSIDDHHAQVFEEAALGAVVDDALVDFVLLDLIRINGPLDFAAIMNGVAF